MRLTVRYCNRPVLPALPPQEKPPISSPDPLSPPGHAPPARAGVGPGYGLAFSLTLHVGVDGVSANFVDAYAYCVTLAQTASTTVQSTKAAGDTGAGDVRVLLAF